MSINTAQDFVRWEGASRDTIDVKRIYIDICEDLVGGVWFSQMLYYFLPFKTESGQWKRNGKLVLKQRTPESPLHYWLPMGREEWWEQCRIRIKQYDRCVDIWEDKLHAIETWNTMHGYKKTPHIRVDWPVFLQLLNDRGATYDFDVTGNSPVIPPGIMEPPTDNPISALSVSPPSSKRSNRDNRSGQSDLTGAVPLASPIVPIEPEHIEGEHHKETEEELIEEHHVNDGGFKNSFSYGNIGVDAASLSDHGLSLVNELISQGHNAQNAVQLLQHFGVGKVSSALQLPGAITALLATMQKTSSPTQTNDTQIERYFGDDAVLSAWIAEGVSPAAAAAWIRDYGKECCKYYLQKSQTAKISKTVPAYLIDAVRADRDQKFHNKPAGIIEAEAHKHSITKPDSRPIVDLAASQAREAAEHERLDQLFLTLDPTTQERVDEDVKKRLGPMILQRNKDNSWAIQQMRRKVMSEMFEQVATGTGGGK